MLTDCQRQFRFFAGDNSCLVQKRSDCKFQHPRILRQQFRGAAHILHRPGIQFLQNRENLVPQHIAGSVIQCVGLILYKGDVVFGCICFQLCTGHLQEGAENMLPVSRDSGQSLQSGAPKQVQQHGLRMIVCVMGRQNGNTSLLKTGFLQKPVAQNTGSFLQRKAFLFRISAGIPAAADAGDFPLCADLLHKRFVPIRSFASQMMIEVGGNDFHAVCLSPCVEKMQQAHGVPSAGHRRQNRLRHSA